MPHRKQPKKTTLADSARFLSQWFENPGVVGAVAPSGPALAKAMASYVDLARGGPIVELGPGTGPVTKALLARRDFGGSPVAGVEYETRFCRMLAERYPGVKIVQGDAYGLKATLAGHVNGEVATVISSLPLLNRPERDRVELLHQAFELMGPDGLFIQFTLRAGDLADARPRPWLGGNFCRQGFGAGSAEHTAGAGLALSPRRSFQRPGEVTSSEAKARDRLIVALDVESVEAGAGPDLDARRQRVLLQDRTGARLRRRARFRQRAETGGQERFPRSQVARHRRHRGARDAANREARRRFFNDPRLYASARPAPALATTVCGCSPSR